MKKLLQKLLPFCALLILAANTYGQAVMINSFTSTSGGIANGTGLVDLPVAGGSTITINGTGFVAGMTISTGEALTVVSANTATYTLAPGTAGAVITPIVTTPTGSSMPSGPMAPTLTYRAALPGSALVLNMGAGSNQYVSVNNTLGNFRTGSFTMEVWFRSTATVTQGIITKRAVCNHSNFYNIAMVASGQIIWEIDDNSTLAYTTIITPGSYNDGRWHHIAVTKSSTTSAIYVDGNLAVSAPLVGNPDFNNTNQFVIGNIVCASNLVRGSVDEVKIYNTALTVENIRADMVSATPSVPANLVAYYNFDQPGSATVPDISGNGNNGVIINAPTWTESYAGVVTTATAATSITDAGFTANWTAPAAGTVNNYVLDVATNTNFTSLVNGSPFTVSGTSQAITGLNPNTNYYYRVRADKTSVTGQGNYSATITAKTNVPIPAISSFTPANGAVGTLVTITGTGLQGATALTIGGVPAVLVSNNNTTVTALVMPGTTTGAVTLTTAFGAATSGGSFVVKPTPVPSKQQGDKITDLTVGGGSGQGTAIALSADGNTALIGGSSFGGNHGAAWVFVRNGATWTKQGNILQGNDEQGNAQQGAGVALSADGNTAIVGGLYDNSIKGAAWVYTRTNGVWTQQGAKLVGSGSVGMGYQGLAVALSADGNTAAVGGLRDNNYTGAVWIYTRANGVWTQQGNKLVASGTGSGTDFGVSVSLSADGNTLIAGSNSLNSGQGGAWVFTRNGSTWTQVTKLLPNDGANPTYFGTYVRLSLDGKKAVIGGSDDNNVKGAAWVFTQVNGTWTQQGPKLTGNDPAGSQSRQGQFVAINADGTVVMVGGVADNSNIGAAWMYTFNGTSWTQLGSKIIGTGAVGNASQGSVAISSDGTTAMLGGSGDNGSRGAVWAFGPDLSNANLTSLTIPGVTTSPVFDTSTTSYTASVSYGVPTVSVKPVLADTAATVQVRVNDGAYTSVINNTTSAPLMLTAGVNIVDVLVTAPDGSTTKKYVFTITRSASLLKSIVVNPSTAAVTAVPGTLDYTATLDGGNDTRIKVAVQLTSSNSKMTINGIAAKSGVRVEGIFVAGTGSDIPIVVTGADSIPQNYVLRITRKPSNNADLATIKVSSVALTKTGATTYTATINGPTLTEVRQMVEAAHGKATIKVNGSPISSGATSDAIPLNVTGSTVITTEITAEDGTTKKTYTVTITRKLSANAELATLKVSSATVAITAPDEYTATVAGSILMQVNLKAETTHAGATMTVNGAPLISGATTPFIALNPTGITPITIEITAENGVTKKIFTVKVVRQLSNDAGLASLAVSSATVVKTSGSVYTATINGSALMQVNLKATAINEGATMTVNGNAVNSGSTSPYIALNATGTTQIVIAVTAEDGFNRRTYVVNVVRQFSDVANLQTLRVSETNLTSTGAFTFTAVLPSTSSLTSVKQQAVAKQSGATITVNGTPVVNGGTTDWIPLDPSGTTVLTTVITAEDGITQKTYIVTVVKEEPVISRMALSSRPPAGNDQVAEQPKAPLTTGIKPNSALSPNGDGITDYFEIAGIENYADNTVTIVNQGGGQVYQAKGYDNKTKVFDGHSAKGALQPAGTYFYVIDYKDGNQTLRKTGYLVIRY